jgi:hypothetical protein
MMLHSINPEPGVGERILDTETGLVYDLSPGDSKDGGDIATIAIRSLHGLRINSATVKYHGEAAEHLWSYLKGVARTLF